MVAIPDRLKRWHAGWPKFWERFGVTLRDRDMVLPRYQPGFNWSIVTPRGITNTRAYEICGELFQCWKYWNDLAELKPANALAKRVDSARVLLVRSGVEADRQLAGQSARMLWQAKTPVLTLKPHLILHARYYLETRRRDENRRHLDVTGWTNCAGSRCSDGGVPRVRWCSVGREVNIRWYYAVSARDDLRARAVVL